MQNRKKYLIVKGRYYILYMKDILNIKSLKYYYVSRQLAKDVIKTHIARKERKYYKVVSGIYLKKYEPDVYAGLTVRPLKYRYSPNMTDREKKSYRLRFRRRLRRMNIFVKQNTSGLIYKKASNVKYVKNKQRVANNINSEARIIQVDRRGKHRWFLINEVTKAKRTGDLFRIHSYCFDFKKRTITYKELRIKNIDILTPYILTELRKKLKAINWEVDRETWGKVLSPRLKKLP